MLGSAISLARNTQNCGKSSLRLSFVTLKGLGSGELGSQIVTPPFSPHFSAPPDCPTFLPTLPCTPTSSFPTPPQHPLPSSQHPFHTPNTFPHTFKTFSHTFPYLPPHPNTFPHFFHIFPILDPTTQNSLTIHTPPNSLHFPNPMLPPLVLLCLLVLSVICRLQTACKQVVAAN